MGGSKKKKKPSKDIQAKKGEITGLSTNIEESSEIVTDLAAELEKTLAEKKKFEDFLANLPDESQQRWVGWGWHNPLRHWKSRAG